MKVACRSEHELCLRPCPLLFRCAWRMNDRSGKLAANRPRRVRACQRHGNRHSTAPIHRDVAGFRPTSTFRSVHSNSFFATSVSVTGSNGRSRDRPGGGRPLYFDRACNVLELARAGDQARRLLGANRKVDLVLLIVKLTADSVAFAPGFTFPSLASTGSLFTQLAEPLNRSRHSCGA